MAIGNCTVYGTESTMIYGYAARRIRKRLDTTLCLPTITNPVEFEVDGEHAKERSVTHLGYQLKQSADPVVIYTNVSKMPPALHRDLEEICNLVDYQSVEFEMCVGMEDVMLPNAEYDGERVRPTEATKNNRCDHDYQDSLHFLQSALGYPSP